jgi:quercetin dioxygenase-like cupin family protein
MTEAPTMTDLADLAALVEVRPDSTVSRTVMRAEGLRIVLFAFDTGQELTEHTAAVPVLLQLAEGRMTVTADGRTVDLLPGGLIHLGTRLPHALKALEPSTLVLSMLDPR